MHRYLTADCLLEELSAVARVWIFGDGLDEDLQAFDDEVCQFASHMFDHWPDHLREDERLELECDREQRMHEEREHMEHLAAEQSAHVERGNWDGSLVAAEQYLNE